MDFRRITDPRRGPRAAAIVAALAFGVAPLASADDAAPPLALDDAIEIALDGNRSLRAAAAGAGAAAAGVVEARAARLPQARLDIDWSRTTNPALVFSSLLGQESFGSENFAIDRLNEPDALSNVTSRVTVTQPLWTGGRIASGIAAATSARDASDAVRERTRQDVVYRVIEAYTGAILAEAQLGVARDALATADWHVRLTRDLRDGGLVVDSDLLQAQVRLIELEELRLRAAAEVAVSRAALNLTLGRDLDTPFRLPVTLAPTARAGDDALADLLAEASSTRPDVRAARLAAAAAGHGVEVERAARLPQVGVAGSYEANSERWFDGGGTNWSVVAGATFTLFDARATGSRIRRAEHERARALTMSEELTAAAELEVYRAFHDLRAARGRHEQTTAAIRYATESLRIVEDRYREGLTTVVELLDAETGLTEARTRDLAARRDVILAAAGLDLAVGRLR